MSIFYRRRSSREGSGMQPQQAMETGFRAIERADGLDDVAKAVQGVVSKATAGRRVKNLLSGVWLGHPAHPPLTDVPIGVFTAATLLDMMPSRRTRDAADVLVGAGLLATLPTVATGSNDWSDTLGASRRVGLVHAASNALATLLYSSSLVCRRRGRRGAGVTLGLFGWLALLIGGALGGHLAYRRGLGVDENAFAPSIGEWQPAIADGQLRDGQPTRVTAGGVEVLLYRAAGRIHAIADRCSHLGGPLHEGEIDREQCLVRCPWHGSAFDLEDGSVVRGPANAPQPRYETRVSDGMIELRTYGLDG